MMHINAVFANTRGHLDGGGGAGFDPVLVGQADPVALLESEPGGQFVVHPHRVFALGSHQPGIVLSAVEGVHRRTAVDQPLESLGRSFHRDVGGDGRVAVLFQFVVLELDDQILGDTVGILAGLDVDATFGLDLGEGQVGAGEHLVDQLLLRLHRDLVAVAHTFGDLVGDVDALLALEPGRDQRHTRGDVLLVLVREVPLRAGFDHVVPFQVRGVGQEDVGVHGDVGGHHVHAQDEIHLLEHFDGLRLGGHGLHGVLPPDDAALDRVGLAGDGRVADQLGRRAGRRVMMHVSHLPQVAFMLSFLFRPADLADLGPLGRNESTLDAKGAEQAGETGEGPLTLEIGPVPGHMTARVDGDMRHVGGQQVGHFLDLGGRDVAFRGCLLERPLLDALGHFLEALAVLLNEVSGVLLVLDEVVHDRQQESGVRARADGHPDVGFRRRGRVARIDHDQFGAVLQPLEVAFEVADMNVFTQVAANEKHDLGVGHVHVLVGRGVDGGHVGGVAHAAALEEAGLGDVVGAHGVFQEAHRVGGRGAVREHGDALGAVGVDNGLELAAAGVQRLLPGDPLPLGRAALADVLERVLEPVRVVQVGHAGVAAGAQGHAVVDGLGVALELDQAAVTDLADQLAAPEAHLADAADRGLGILEAARRNQRRLDDARLGPGRHLGQRHGRSGKRGGLEEIPPGEVRCHLLFLLGEKVD